MDTKARVKQLIDIYDKTETQDTYNRRSNNESNNIKEVLAAIKNQRFSLTDKQTPADFIHMLKAAEAISLSSGPNYLEQFIQIPSVQVMLEEKFTGDSIKKLTDVATENIIKGTVPDFPETMAEMDKNSAEIYLGHPNLNKTPTAEYERFGTRIKEIQDKNVNVFTISTDAKTLEDVPEVQDMRIRLARIILRQNGMNPGEIQLKDGKLFVVMDEPDKEPIFHVKRQTRGMSFAKLEEIKNKTEAEQRHKEENQELQDEKEQIVQETNKKSWNKTSTRSEGVDRESKKAMFARTAQTTDYGAKAKSFQQSLKVAIDHSEQHTRNVLLHNDNKNKAKRKSHGMSR